MSIIDRLGSAANKVRTHFSTPSAVRDAQGLLRIFEDERINTELVPSVATRIYFDLEEVQADEHQQAWINSLKTDLNYATSQVVMMMQGAPAYDPSKDPKEYVPARFLLETQV